MSVLILVLFIAYMGIQNRADLKDSLLVSRNLVQVVPQQEEAE